MIPAIQYVSRRFKQDFTCWDFVRLIYQEQFAITLTPYAVNGALDQLGAARAAEIEKENPEWQPSDICEPNCLVIMGKGKHGFHAGIAVTSSMVIHLEGSRVYVQTMADISANFKTVQFFRHANLYSCS